MTHQNSVSSFTSSCRRTEFVDQPPPPRIQTMAALCPRRTKPRSLKLMLKPILYIIPSVFILLTTSCILFYFTISGFLFLHPEQTHAPLHQSATRLGLNSSSTPRNHRHSLSSIGSHKSSPFGTDNAVRHNSSGILVDNEVFHDKDFFMANYKEMKESFKIYVYSHRRDHPFANVLLPVNFEPGGNYASESYFKKVLLKSHFITKDPSQADLFFLPFSIARLRHDLRVGIDGIQDFIRDYVYNISHEYPFWNCSGGSDHFYVACHSVGRSATDKAVGVKLNAIQVVCSSSYYVSTYVAHKDASLPQIWPRHGKKPDLVFRKRERLAFFAGALNSPVREKLIQVWGNDSEISVHSSHLDKPYSEALLGSKFCLHVKGFEVNTARVGDAIYFGCVPVIIANHYDLPFADILNWKSFSVVIATLDIPQLKKILEGISKSDYALLKRNVLEVRKHFQWHLCSVDFDAFHMVMMELWLRRNSMRIFGDL